MSIKNKIYTLTLNPAIDVHYALDGGIDSGDLLVFSGRISDTSDKDGVIALLRRMSERGVRLVLDSASLSLDDIACLKPFLIKPNTEELAALVGRSITDREGAVENASRLRKLCERVLVTLGADGAVLVAEKIYAAEAPSITAVSATGAGDSALAGFIVGYLSDLDEGECLRLAVAFGSAAAMTSGTLPPDPCQIKELYSRVNVVEE